MLRLWHGGGTSSPTLTGGQLSCRAGKQAVHLVSDLTANLDNAKA